MSSLQCLIVKGPMFFHNAISRSKLYPLGLTVPKKIPVYNALLSRFFSDSLRRGSTNFHQPVVIGGSISDLVIKVEEASIQFNGRTHKGSVTQHFGGVGRNIADALTRLGSAPLFISAVGMDQTADALINHNPELDCRGILRTMDKPTASYSVLLDSKGEALIGVGNMEIHDLISPEWVRKFESDISKAPLVVLDGNMSHATIETVLQICADNKVPVWYEPTDIRKAIKPWEICSFATPTCASPNLSEFNEILKYSSGENAPKDITVGNDQNNMKQILSYCERFLPSVQLLMLTFGHRGFMVIRRCRSGEEDSPVLENLMLPHEQNNILTGMYFNAPEEEFITSVSGAGDCLASGFIYGMLLRRPISECASIGLACAALSLQASEAVPNALNSLRNTRFKGATYSLIQL